MIDALLKLSLAVLVRRPPVAEGDAPSLACPKGPRSPSHRVERWSRAAEDCGRTRSTDESVCHLVHFWRRVEALQSPSWLGRPTRRPRCAAPRSQELLRPSEAGTKKKDVLREPITIYFAPSRRKRMSASLAPSSSARSYQRLACLTSAPM